MKCGGREGRAKAASEVPCGVAQQPGSKRGPPPSPLDVGEIRTSPAFPENALHPICLPLEMPLKIKEQNYHNMAVSKEEGT